MDNACTFCLTATAGTELVGTFALGTLTIFPKTEGFTANLPSTVARAVRRTFTPELSPGQALAHCQGFPTAASNLELEPFSVPMWPDVLPNRLRVISLERCSSPQLLDSPISDLTAINLSYISRIYLVFRLINTGL